jgi:hypothetical protein
MTRRFTHAYKPWLLIVLIIILPGCETENRSADRNQDPALLLPEAPAGWEETSETRVFTGLALADYIDGGAEAYHAYAFERLAVREFRNDANARLTVEIYQMNNSENAYGIFSMDSAGEQWPVGADSSYGDGLLRFWKGPYFVRILCFPADTSTAATIRKMGNGIAGSIAAESRRPEILKLLPLSNVLRHTVCYFHRQTSLNNIRFLSAENVLHLGDDVDALTWEQWVTDSAEGQQRGRLRQIVLQYTSPPKAEAAARDFADEFLDVSGSLPLTTRHSQHAYASVDQSETWLIIALDAPSAESAEEAVASTKAALSVFNQREGSS